MGYEIAKEEIAVVMTVDKRNMIDRIIIIIIVMINMAKIKIDGRNMTIIRK